MVISTRAASSSLSPGKANHHSQVVPLIILAVIAGIGIAALRDRPLESDALGYYEMSVDLLRGDVREFYWPVGWPAALAGVQWIFGESQSVVKAFSCAIAVITLVMQLHLVRWLGLGLSGGRIAVAEGVILLNAPYLMYHGMSAFVVVPMVFLGTCLAYSLLLTRLPWIAGILTGLLAIVRAGSLAVLAVVVGWGARRSHRVGPLVAAGVLGILLFGAAVAWVSHKSHRFVPLNTANSINLFYGNHRDAPLYETWRWGSHDDDQKKRAISKSLAAQGLEGTPVRSPAAASALGVEAVRQIISRPDLFVIRCVTRGSLLMAFDSSIGARMIKGGDRMLGYAFLGGMLILSLITKTCVVVGGFGSAFPHRRLCLWLLVGLVIPHVVAFAHPSYGHMFVTMVLPLAAVGAASADRRQLAQHGRIIWPWGIAIIASHAMYLAYMAGSRS